MISIYVGGSPVTRSPHRRMEGSGVESQHWEAEAEGLWVGACLGYALILYFKRRREKKRRRKLEKKRGRKRRMEEEEEGREERGAKEKGEKEREEGRRRGRRIRVRASAVPVEAERSEEAVLPTSRREEETSS